MTGRTDVPSCHCAGNGEQGLRAAPGVYFGDMREACDLARSANEYAAGLGARHGRRFGAFVRSRVEALAASS